MVESIAIGGVFRSFALSIHFCILLVGAGTRSRPRPVFDRTTTFVGIWAIKAGLEPHQLLPLYWRLRASERKIIWWSVTDGNLVGTILSLVANSWLSFLDPYS
jgi:hypothetical protein